jgi:hypothetical protein
MRVFWDTNLFVYLWEGSVRTRQVEALINWQHQHEAELVASTLNYRRAIGSSPAAKP